MVRDRGTRRCHVPPNIMQRTKGLRRGSLRRRFKQRAPSKRRRKDGWRFYRGPDIDPLADAAAWPPRDGRALGLHGFQQAYQHVGACCARTMTDLDIDALEFAVPHEFEELRLGVTPI